MLTSHRCFAVPELRARMETHAVIGTPLRVHVVRLAGVVSEDRLLCGSFPRRGHVGRPMVTFLLDGRARLSTPEGERWLSPGTLALIPEKASVLMRQDGSDGFLCVNIEWDPGALGERPRALDAGPLPPAACDRLRALARELATAQEPSQSVATLLALARSLGCPVRAAPVDELSEAVDDQTRRLSRVLDALLSDLGGQPMMVDIHRALGVSDRTANRLVDQFNHRYGFNAASWQDTRTRRRIFTGACMMTAPGARTETVALAVGYASPAAFCRALSRVGLPSPGNIAAAADRAA